MPLLPKGIISREVKSILTTSASVAIKLTAWLSDKKRFLQCRMVLLSCSKRSPPHRQPDSDRSNLIWRIANELHTYWSHGSR